MREGVTMTRLVLCFVLALFACSKSEPPAPSSPTPAPTASSPSPAVPPPTAASATKDPETARKLIAEGALVFDVRTQQEYAEGHLANATNIPVDEFAARLDEVGKLVGPDKSRPVVVYCAAGKRAAKAKAQLDAAGYTHVVNGGGLDDLQ
jgi:phage shock protein E